MKTILFLLILSISGCLLDFGQFHVEKGDAGSTDANNDVEN